VLPQQLRQFRDVHGNPPRFILGEQLGCGSPAGLILEIDIGQLLLSIDQGGGKRRSDIRGRGNCYACSSARETAFGSFLMTSSSTRADARGVRVPNKGALSKRPLLVGISSSSQQNV
jgi:hypothetical protein